MKLSGANIKLVGAVLVSAGTVLAFTAFPAGAAAPQGPWVHPAADLSAAGQRAFRPQVTVAPDGSATAVWQRFDGSNTIVQAATRPPGGSFGAPVDLSDSGQNAEKPEVTTSPDGNTTAVWQRSDGSNTIIQAAIRPPNGAFGVPVDLSIAGQNAGKPQVTTSPDGTTTAVWERWNGTKSVIQAASRGSGRPFGNPVTLSEPEPGLDAYAPQIAAGADTTAIVVWYRFFGGSKVVVQASIRPLGEPYSDPVDISDAGQAAYGPRIAFAPDGTATAVWRRDNFGITSIQAATRPPGGTFAAPVDVSVPGKNAYEPQVAFTPDGTANSVWRLSSGGGSIIQSAARPPGGSFGTPVDLSAAGGDANAPQVSSAPDGSAVAVWRSFKGNDIIQSISTLQPTPLLGVAKTGSGDGTVSSTPGGIDCGTVCASTHPSFTKVTLTATPDSGSFFKGWQGACADQVGKTCELTMLGDQNVIAGFRVLPDEEQAGLEIIRVNPKNPKVEPGEQTAVKVTGKNTGDLAAKGAKLCVKVNQRVKNKLKPKGKACRKLGRLDSREAETRTFRLKATGEAIEGKKYVAKYVLKAKRTDPAKRRDKVKVR